MRDFWQNGNPVIGDRLDFSNARSGDLLIFEKIITVEGTSSLYPCHMAIVSEADEKGPLTVIHATLKSGETVEEELQDYHRERVVGGIAINPKKLIT